ncbi:binding-protein-dependent transport systems inner membrane component [Ruminiclostridium papyrosolvens DSM 2782]|uniref:Binding-protein-dependent transport systems inner membrane component n=1 Tax=Ruminiclostridium papyrosolvens DSM 2782 TaxID=588581 RepID=F1TFV0_9FIRM|nr:methionine ABC transporter permease [Ruminiclostridium papyrosolvens]EGD46832.1 binding-protein-dependent transport systems inner membrane component [Ruminiclostridium papyrosolvens DSM 2782]WES34317.1 ABC transporter permease [Ruminiclostridium papyrosolvens DSM 2782]
MEYSLEILSQLGKASRETLLMVSIATVIGCVAGLFLGLILYITSINLLYKNRAVNTIAGFIINIIRSIPFVILLVLLVPVTSKVVGTAIGPKAASVPLTVASVAFFARLAEASFEEVDKGLIEAALAMGGGIKHIVSGVLLVEALPSLIRATTVTIISIIGYSAMAGTVGGGGIGDLAVRFGYYRYQMDVMFITVIFLIVIVQAIQVSGEKIAKLLTKN